jgi:hypothetical protein
MVDVRDNDEDWGEEVRPLPGVRKRLDAVVSVRFSSEELDSIYKVAPQGDLVGFIKRAALAASVVGETDEEMAARMDQLLTEHADVVERLRSGDASALGELLEACTGAKILSESVRVLPKAAAKGVQSS